jgi:hypothetical protein
MLDYLKKQPAVVTSYRKTVESELETLLENINFDSEKDKQRLKKVTNQE